MTFRSSRRRAVQAALVTAAVATLPRSRAAAQPATPVPGEAAITAAQVDAALDRLDRLIAEGMTQTGVPGTAVAVVYDDAVVYERGFGVREFGQPEPITPETVFQIASLAKPISSTLVAAVVGDGTTTWDATIGSLDPGFALSDPYVSEQVTIRDLLCHRSGLPAYSGDPLINYFRGDREECLRRLRYYALAPFRTTWAYSKRGRLRGGSGGGADVGRAGRGAAARAAGDDQHQLPLRRFRAMGEPGRAALPHAGWCLGTWRPDQR
jgi:CubicO group peptidase (beta-lactamase class C family)